ESTAAKRSAQPRDVSVERLLDARRRPLAPERVDQPVARDDLVRVQHEHGEQRALLRAAERDEPAVDPHLERAENRGLHATSKARLQADCQVLARCASYCRRRSLRSERGLNASGSAAAASFPEKPTT